MSIQQILIQVGIALGVVSLNALINTSIKFAPNADHAKESVKRIFGQ